MNHLLNPDFKFKAGEDWIYYAKTVYGQEEIDAVVGVLKEDWLANGKHTEEFEEKITARFGKKYGLFVNSGSSANLLALEVLDLPKGSEVITPACTFGTTVSPMIMKGLVPVFLDSTIPTYNIDLDLIEGAITEKTSAIMAPHAIGNINDMKRLRDMCDKYGLKLIEDSCDTIGSLLDGEPAGRFSDVTTTSLYATHNMTAGGGGGMVMFNSPELKLRAKMMRDWGRALPEYYDANFEDRYHSQIGGIDYDGKYVFLELGYNMKAVEMQAAFGLAQLKRLDAFNQTRRKHYETLRQFFSQYEKYFYLPEELPNAMVYWLSLPITLKPESGIDRKDLLKFMEQKKIQTRLLFAGNILLHPAYEKLKGQYRIHGSLDNADFIMKHSFLVAVHHGLTDEMVKYIMDMYVEYIEQHKK